MSWRITDDAAEFGAEAGRYLAADPATCTVLLTVSAAVRAEGPCAYDPEGRAPARFGWWRDGGQGTVRGAFVQTPPHQPLLGPMPERAAAELAAALAAVGPDVPVNGAWGPAAGVEAFTRACGRAASALVESRSRLFRLGEPTWVLPRPAGQARAAVVSDAALVGEWFRDFGTAADSPALLRRRIAEGRLLLWEVDGTPVSMAGRSALVAGQVRVAPVYTPGRLRRRGYAGAVTAAVGEAARAAGAEQVVLFTDLANPTSNALYPRLGYRPVADFLSVRW